MTLLDLLADSLLVILDLLLYLIDSLLQFLLLQLKQCLFLDRALQFLLDLLDPFLVLLMQVLDLLNILVYGDFLSVHPGLMGLVEISFFSQFFPGGLCLLSGYLGIT